LPEGAVFCDACGKSVSSANAQGPDFKPWATTSTTPYNAPAYNPNPGSAGTVVRHKSGAVAVLLALLVPGLGHLYLRKYVKAVIYFGLSVLFLVLISQGLSSAYEEGYVDGSFYGGYVLLLLVLTFAVYIVQLLDAGLSRK
jgi:TM2 domain-containing membrane protein YozV